MGKKTRSFNVRLTEEEADDLAEVAAHHGRTAASLVRWLVKAELRKLGLGAMGRSEGGVAPVAAQSRPGGFDD